MFHFYSGFFKIFPQGFLDIYCSTLQQIICKNAKNYLLAFQMSYQELESHILSIIPSTNAKQLLLFLQNNFYGDFFVNAITKEESLMINRKT